MTDLASQSGIHMHGQWVRSMCYWRKSLKCDKIYGKRWTVPCINISVHELRLALFMRQTVMSQTEAAFPSKFDILNGDMHF